jgi:aspartate/methionine/tyrosine aminotransferase
MAGRDAEVPGEVPSMNRRFHPFALERLLSQWENTVECNLSESGVHPVSLQELVTEPDALAQLLSTPLTYPQTDGIPELRARIAALYPGASAGHVLVTNGCAEANFNSLQTLAGPGDEVVLMQPNYMQMWGAAQNAGMEVRTFALSAERGWRLDTEGLEAAVTRRTRVIAVSNPNNPTGHILTDDEMGRLVDAAERVGAWLLADEVYAGSERLRPEPAPSFWGRYDRVIVTGGLSKAYGLPGLRIGWVVAPRDTRDQIWARQDYTSISTSVLSNRLAGIALSPDVRSRLIERGRRFVREGFDLLSNWIAAHGGLLSVTPPDAGAIGFVRYALPLGSTELCRRLLEQADVLAVPGDCFGVDHHLRLNHGLPAAYVQKGLDRISALLTALA